MRDVGLPSLERAGATPSTARAARREPTFAPTALITLSLGIATTTVFTADTELWKPLPFPAPEKLVAVRAKGWQAQEHRAGVGARFPDGREAQGWRSMPQQPSAGARCSGISQNASASSR
jgi:hypothetical protein